MRFILDLNELHIYLRNASTVHNLSIRTRVDCRTVHARHRIGGRLICRPNIAECDRTGLNDANPRVFVEQLIYERNVLGTTRDITNCCIDQTVDTTTRSKDFCVVYCVINFTTSLLESPNLGYDDIMIDSLKIS